MKKYFFVNNYRTPSDRRRYFGDLLLLKSRIYFYLLLLKRILWGSFVAKKGKYTMEYWVKSSYDTFADLEGCGIKFDFTGIDNLKKLDGSVVFIGNHMSNLETFILPSIIVPYKPITFVIKESLIKTPFFGAIMRSTNPICVGRKNPRRDFKYVLKHSIENLNKGISVFIFPQSTRTSGFSLNHFNSLGIKIAAKAGVYAVPLALKTDALEKGKVIKEFGKLNRGKTVYISIGKPVKIKGNGREQHKVIAEYIASQLTGWGMSVN